MLRQCFSAEPLLSPQRQFTSPKCAFFCNLQATALLKSREECRNRSVGMMYMYLYHCYILSISGERDTQPIDSLHDGVGDIWARRFVLCSPHVLFAK